MSDLSRNTRALLDAASHASYAPLAARHRGRQRLLRTITTGGIVASSIAVKGALGATSTSASLVTTWFTAIAVGLSTGLVALSPASHEPQATRIQTTSAHSRVERNARAPSQRPTGERNAWQAIPSSDRIEPVRDDAPPLPRSRMVNQAATRLPLPDTKSTSLRDAEPVPEAALAVGDSVQPTRGPEVAEAPSPDVVTPTKPNKASIARETELLAQAQQALRSGRALLAMSILDRYAEECPLRTLNEEATAARVVTLCALRRYDDGHDLAEVFSRRYPDSPLTARVKNACPAGAPKR